MKKHVETKKSFWKMGCLAAVSVVWLIIRTGGKPSRITYPCQKAAVANINIFLLVSFAPLLDVGKFKTALPRAPNSRVTTTVLLVGSLLLAFGSLAFTGNYVPIETTFAPVPLDLQTHSAVSSINSSDLFFVENASGIKGNMDDAVSSLLQLMADHGLFFFRTAAHPSGLIGKDDVVILKVNSQWPQRGGTNTDLVKSIISIIVNHPEGFTGEVVIADNGQWMDRTDQNQWYTEVNAYDHSQSMVMVANSFPSYIVSTWLWDIIRSKSVSEYNQGDFNDGYIVSPDQSISDFHVSYPKFETKYGTYVSLKNGIWNNATNSYDSGKLKLINIPVLKSHGAFGVSGSIKHYMGVLTNKITDGHGTIAYGAMGTEMAQSRFPTLNILDAIWVNANPIESGDACGPDTSYEEASYTNVIGASRDPVALDYWGAKNVLIPAAIAKGYTAYSSLDPNCEPISSPLMIESFHNYLERSMDELKKNGFQVTMNEDEMNVYVSSTLTPVYNLNTNRTYRTIQAAIDANETLNGHAVYVGTGTYYEHIAIDKSILLIGEDNFDTIIDGNETGSVATITADNAKISGFTIRGSGLGPSGSDSGIYVNSSNNTISGNRIMNNMAGITVTSSNSNHVIENTIANNTWGISIDQSDASEIYHNSFLNNMVQVHVLAGQARPFGVTASSYSDGHPPGLAIDGIENPSNYWGTDATVPEGQVPQWLNVDLGSPLPISMITTHFYDGSTRTYTYYVEVSNDSSSWTRIVSAKTGSGSVTDTFPQVGARFVRITVTANTANLAAHIEEIKIYRSIDSTGNNSWDDGYPSGGNYWSNFNAPDANMDKIGDLPYKISENSVDRYPLIYPFEFYQPEFIWTPDLNKDGKVNMLDIGMVAKAFNSKPGSAGWNAVADADINEKINMVDVAKVAINFGKVINVR